MSAVKMSTDSDGRQCRSLLSTVNVGLCVAGLTEFSHCTYSLVYALVTGNVTCYINCLLFSAVHSNVIRTRMWANAQRDGRPVQYKWRPLFNAANFG